ncbi:MAG: ComEC/Rec2 family competence protein [Patescibacteria group bacterium]
MSKIKDYIPSIVIFILVSGAIILWQAVFYYEARFQKLFVYALDVGQGDALFIEAPGGNQILIDGGPDKTVVTRLGEVMLPWDRFIDVVVLTHPHADHISGLLEVLKRYQVGRVIESSAPHSIPEYSEWRKIIEDKKIPVTIATRGQILFAGKLQMKILYPENDTDRNSGDPHSAMVVLKMEYGSTTALLMGDAEKKIEYKLASFGDDLSVDLLKIGHHGSKTSTSEFFLSRVRPRYAVISVGRKNRYGHPYKEVLDRLQANGIKIFRTDLLGTIIFMSDGRNFFLKK